MLSAQFAAPLRMADIDQPGGFSSIPSLTATEPLTAREPERVLAAANIKESRDGCAGGPDRERH